MRMSHRLRRLEDRVGLAHRHAVPIIWDGKNLQMWQARVEGARARGCPINLIMYEYSACAGSVEEAQDLIASHVARGAGFAGLKVHRRGDRDDILALHRPEIPDWLQGFEDEGSI